MNPDIRPNVPPPYPQNRPQFPASPPPGMVEPPVILPAPQKPKKRKKVLLILFIVLLLAGAGVAYYLLTKEKPAPVVNAPVVDPAAAYLLSDRKIVCDNQAVAALTCENLETKELKKYKLPQEVGVPYHIVPSPDETKFVVFANPDPAKADEAGVRYLLVDKDFKILQTLPGGSLNEDGYAYTWLNDSKTLVYDLRTLNAKQEFGKSQLYTYNTETKTKKQLTNIPDGVYAPAVSKDGKTVYAYGQKESAKPEQILAVSVETGKAQEIGYKALGDLVSDSMGDFSRFFYAVETDRFYAAGYTKDDTPKSTIVVAKLKDTDGKLSLEREAVVDNARLEDTGIITTKGISIGSDKGAVGAYEVLGLGGQKTTLKAKRGLSVLFTLKNELALKAEADNKLVAADFYYTYVTPSAKAKAFLEPLVTKGCKEGEFRRVILEAEDAVAGQLRVLQDGSCEPTGASYFYAAEGNTYKQLLVSQEGVDCDNAAKLKLSKKVLPSCLERGVGL